MFTTEVDQSRCGRTSQTIPRVGRRLGEAVALRRFKVRGLPTAQGLQQCDRVPGRVGIATSTPTLDQPTCRFRLARSGAHQKRPHRQRGLQAGVDRVDLQQLQPAPALVAAPHDASRDREPKDRLREPEIAASIDRDVLGRCFGPAGVEKRLEDLGRFRRRGCVAEQKRPLEDRPSGEKGGPKPAGLETLLRLGQEIGLDAARA